MLPRLPYNTSARQSVQTELLGINFSDNYKDGQLSDSRMISARRYPYIATKKARQDMGYEGVSAIYAWDGLWTVRNGKLYKDGTEIQGLTLTAGEKQFVSMRKKLVIFPDNVYIYLDTLTPYSMAAETHGEGATITITEDQDEEKVLRECKVMIDWVDDLTSKFTAGDVIEISGFDNAVNNGYKTIKELSNDYIIVDDDTMVEEVAANEITFTRSIPVLDYVCARDNRIWGCSNDTRTIYASRIDDPTNFWDMSGNDNDSWQLYIATEGDFTGCASMSGSVIFFKEHSIIKVLGSYAAEFQTNNFQMEGVKYGCSKSIQNIGETLIYVGLNGVYVYNGGTASLISSVFGEKRLENAVAGHDGEHYYLSADVGGKRLFLMYHRQTGLWLIEDNLTVLSTTLSGETVYLLDNNGHVLIENAGTEAVDFSMTFKPVYETMTGSYNRSSVAFARKRYSRLYLRTEIGVGANLKIEIKEDGGLWKEVSKIVGKGGLTVIPVPIGRCDKYELRLSGKGPFTLLNMEREYRIGSAR